MIVKGWRVLASFCLILGIVFAVRAEDPPVELPPPRPIADPVVPKKITPPEVIAEAPLTLYELLDSVDGFFPLLRAVEQERQIVQGRLTSAEGVFDLNLRGRQSWNEGSFPNERFNIGVDRPTPFMGTSFYSGYRIAGGNFPVYYGDRFTGDGGEFRAGMTLPLLRDRAVDQRRATINKAQLGVQLAEPAIAMQYLDTQRDASRAYWNWIAAGQRLAVADRVLSLAVERDEQIAERVKKGVTAAIDRTDNERLIVDRRARRVVALRAFQQASINLSLYLRDEEGQPVIPTLGRLPRPAFPDPAPPPGPDAVRQDVELALQQRPELQQVRLRREQIQVDIRLAENQTAPGLNMVMTGAQDVGFSKKKDELDRTTYEAALILDVPLQRRDARGKLLTAQGQLAQLGAQEQFLRDRITAEVQDMLSALEQAYNMRKQATENVRLALELERAEVTKYQLGQSNLIFVNVRELAAAEAKFLEIDALAEFFRSYADYRAALGLLNRP